MLKHKLIDKICIAVMALALIITILFMNGESLGLIPSSSAPGYVSRLFDKSGSIPLIFSLMTGTLLATATEENIPLHYRHRWRKIYQCWIACQGE